MRFVSSLLAASAALVAAAPSQAATYIVTGVGETNLSYTTIQSFPCSTLFCQETTDQQVRVSFTFVVNETETLFYNGITSNGFIFTEELGQQAVNYSRSSAFGTANPGSNLLTGGSGTASFDYYQETRGFRRSFSLQNATFSVRLADAGPLPSSGFTTAAVPEPATWAMMIAGFGLVGAGMRRSSIKAGARQFRS